MHSSRVSGAGSYGYRSVVRKPEIEFELFRTHSESGCAPIRTIWLVSSSSVMSGIRAQRSPTFRSPEEGLRRRRVR